VTEYSCQAALGAVGATLTVSRRILAERHGRGFAIVRPPGHHAEPDHPMGFCLMNNIAIAAADAVASGAGKVAIIDFDAHHGNGTQAAFWRTSEVGYLSTHEMNIYPGSGRIESASHARGRIINIPLPSFSNTQAFVNIFQQVAAPWLRNFGAEMLLVSAGFDPHFSDPLTTLTLDTAGFFRIAQMLVDLADEFCQGRILFVLEGGYDPLAVRDNIQACLAALCGQSSFPDHYGRSPGGRSEDAAIIEKLKNLHHLKED
jgi:acetoin utilization deacetylase AcuC-like enzyme